MANYMNFLDRVVVSYRNPQTVGDVIRSKKRKMKDRLAVDYVPPSFEVHYATKSRRHPYGGEANNWVESPSFYGLDFMNMARDVCCRKILSGDKNIRTMPNLKMSMYLNSSEKNLEPIKRHEFDHMNFYAIPYNLVYIFMQKRYDELKRKGVFTETFSEKYVEKLASDAEIWLYGDCSPLPMNRRDDYKIEPRIDKVTNFVDSLNLTHDSIENENNVYYTKSDLDDAIMDFYDDQIKEMDYQNSLL